MTWKDSVRKVLMGTPYEEIAVAAPTEVIMSSPVPVAIDAPEPALANEEALIQHMRRAELRCDAPVLSSQGPLVQAAVFRDRFALPTKNVEAETRARLQMEADAPVSAHPSRLVMSPEIDRAERLAERRSYESLVPVARKALA